MLEKLNKALAIARILGLWIAYTFSPTGDVLVFLSKGPDSPGKLIAQGDSIAGAVELALGVMVEKANAAVSKADGRISDIEGDKSQLVTILGDNLET